MDIRASRNALATEWDEVLDLMVESALDPVPWISHRPTLDSIRADLPNLMNDERLLVKAMVELDAGEVYLMATKGRLLLLAESDNVYIVAAAVAAGEDVSVGEATIRIREDVQLGHKVAARPIARGQQIVRAGMPIGRATKPIAPGDWVHTHNLMSDYIKTFERRGGDHD